MSSQGQPGDYPREQQFWTGNQALYIGSGIYSKSILLVSLQIYTVAIYVDFEAARLKAKELQQAGFFKNKADGHVCEFLNSPGFKKVLHLKLLRDVSTSRFISELSKDLGPRVAGTSGQAVLQQFVDYLQGQQVKAGCSLACVWDESDTLAGGLFPPGFEDWQQTQPPMAIRDASFCRAMFGMYIDAKSVTPSVRKVWAQGILSLLG